MVQNLTDGDLKFYYADDPNDLLKFADIKISGYQVYRDPGFETEVTIRLFSDRRADKEDKLPNKGESRRGWWADEFLDEPLGSKLWLLGRSRNNDETITNGKQYIKDALAPMVTNGEADEILAEGVRGSRVNEINFLVAIIRKDNTSIFTKFFVNWEHQIYGGLL